ncbi:MAG TPA: cyclic nucleotide-binding domain-containing protein [Candidatus Margulisiibacteriota bacterium]|nr:cyclic nucleotide-binding domain-containing protein [Candidatus Margulisiibacteriota bacterium]
MTRRQLSNTFSGERLGEELPDAGLAAAPPPAAEDLARVAALLGMDVPALSDAFTHRQERHDTHLRPIRAAVRRIYQQGDIICKAGAYGSTAFLLVAGSATAFVPEQCEQVAVPGRSARSLRRFRDLFSRRTTLPRSRAVPPDLTELGEISAYATLACATPPPETHLKPGDFFGLDTCLNFYPREATVRADEPCVVIEMLRSVFDVIRKGSAAAKQARKHYFTWSIRGTLERHSLFDQLSSAQLDDLAAAAELSQLKSGNLVFSEGETADAIFVIRTGMVKIAQQRLGGEFIWAYLGRGAVFGLEGLLPALPSTQLMLKPLSHPALGLPTILLTGTVSVGRRPAAKLAFPDSAKSVSRTHCRFESRDGTVSVVDEGSDNGTFLNGRRIQRERVAAGDRIQLASDYEFEVVTAPPQAPTESVKRRVTATALDEVELVELPVEALLQVTTGSEPLLRAAKAAAADLETKQQQAPSDQLLLHELVDQKLYNSQNVLLIDLDRCTRCDECVRACADAHGGIARFTRDGPRFGKHLVTLACRSCTDPQCMRPCPVGSIRRRDSLEVHIESWCIGCGQCAANCPFGNINMVDVTVDVQDDNGARHSERQQRATVCDLCAGYDGPNCVYACPHDAAIRVKPTAYLSSVDLRRS